jgi:hypothetical protein
VLHCPPTVVTDDPAANASTPYAAPVSTTEVELIGGPEDGKAIRIPIGPAGVPMSPFVFPARYVPSREADAQGSNELPAILKYERLDHDAGRWRYRYAGVDALWE